MCAPLNDEFVPSQYMIVIYCNSSSNCQQPCQKLINAPFFVLGVVELVTNRFSWFGKVTILRPGGVTERSRLFGISYWHGFLCLFNSIFGINSKVL